MRRMIIRGGRVHGVGFRSLLLGIAESLEGGGSSQRISTSMGWRPSRSYWRMRRIR
ncbi:hypothetical protein KEJ49_06605 [Candidatus Bathyarchaeota archaeon]|nr:hypothetical protein [Candidatus Bathyarchaeota archaeon]